MDLFPYFRSILEQDPCAVVVCDLAHTIIYMNPTAKVAYAKYGGGELLGKSLLDCHPAEANAAIERVVRWFAASPQHNRVHTFYNAKQQKDGYMVALRDQDGQLIGYYEQHAFRTRDLSPLYQLPEA